MSPQNPYVPPVAPVDDIQVPVSRSEFGLRLSASLFWRVLVLQFLVTIPIAFSLASVNELFRLKPTATFLCLALVVAASLPAVRSGALSLMWGQRLGLDPAAWRRFHWMLFWLYLALALGNILLFAAAPVAVWVQVKTYVPLASIVALCAAAPRYLRNVA